MNNIIIVSRYSNSYISETTGMTPPTRSPSKRLLLSEDDFGNDFFVLIHASDSRQSKNSEECFFIFCSTFKLSFPNHYIFDFPHQKLNQKHSTFRPVFNLKIIAFLSHQTPDSIEIPRKHITFNFVRCFNQKLFSNENILDGSSVDYIPCIGILIFRYSKPCYL